MKVHITLVGGQPAPVYHGIVATNPDLVVFIYSISTKHVLNVLKKEIALPYYKTPPLDPTNPVVIKQTAESLAKKFADDEITVNISSGLKSWSHLFGVVFDSLPNATIVYIDQNNILWDYKKMQWKSDFIFDIYTLFRLYGNSFENNYKKFVDYTTEDYDVMTRIEKHRQFHIPTFTSLTAKLAKKQGDELKYQKSGRFELLNKNSVSYVEWKKSEGQSGVVRLCIYNGDEFQEEIYESPNVIDIVFNSGWFEYKVTSILSKWDKAKDICLNCRFPFRQNIDKNETDVIVNTGTKTLFVECKTQITHITDIDKFRSVVKGYGGTGSKGLFITYSKMTDVARKKCKENGLLLFSMQDYHRGMSAEQALYDCLDNELFNINV